MDDFTKGYVEAALTLSTDDDNTPLNTGEYELAQKTAALMVADCEQFERENAELLGQWYELGIDPAQAGQDFWLTRVGHGFGFWDHYSDNPGLTLGQRLTKVCEAYPSVELYVGDDGLIYSCT